MLYPIFLHLLSSDQQRFDTLEIPNGSIAALCAISRSLGYRGVAIDEAYPGPEAMERRLYEEIEAGLYLGDTPVVFCSVLSYNAQRSLDLLRKLKAEYGSRIRTGVGGQLIRANPQAYLAKPYLDHVAVGDAEVTLAPLLAGSRYEHGYLQLGPDQHYAPFDFSTYYGIGDRLNAMALRKDYFPEGGVRQLTVESVRGCSWAYAHGTCTFCSLQGIDLRPSFKSWEEHFTGLRNLVEAYGINWVFDVSNQWLPVMGKKAEQWLEEYIAAGKRFGCPLLNRYVYLTSNSVTSATAPLLRQAGVRTAFVGIDGINHQMRQAYGKAEGVAHMLKCLRDNDICLRTGLVLGSGLTKENLEGLPGFVRYLLDECGDRLLAIACYLVMLLPGSSLWESFQKEARERGLQEAITLYERFAADGYLSFEDECSLSREYINATQPVRYEEAQAAQQAVLQMMAEVGKVRGLQWKNG